LRGEIGGKMPQGRHLCKSLYRGLNRGPGLSPQLLTAGGESGDVRASHSRERGVAEKSNHQSDAGKSAETRKARLSSGLRANLKRRKSQSRARDETEAPGKQSRKSRKTLIDPA
jgi:hypothetical protein